MKHKVIPEDFVVEERIRLRFTPRGPWAVYRVRKRAVTTLSVQAQMARALGVAQSDIVFPALKDKDAVALQHASVHGTGPERLAGGGFEAEFAGRSPRPLTPGDVIANHFTIVLRDLSTEEAVRIEDRLAQVAQSGLPNYFDQQRFGSLVPGEDHIAKHILQRDAEGALRAYLTQPFAGDPEPVRAFKALARGQWGDWDALFEAAPRPSNLRSVLTYLRDHPTEHRKALNLVTHRLLSIYLSAYQSLLWNRIAGRYLAAQLGEALAQIEIAGECLALYRELPPRFNRDVAVPLPHHRAVYAEPDVAAIVEQVLTEEGLAVSDLKARILKKAYLSKGKRALLLFPQDLSASPSDHSTKLIACPDECFPDRSKLTLVFTLPRGSYATLVLKALAA